MGPMSAVMNEIRAGATGRADIAQRTGLTRSTVDAVIERLEAMGKLRREGLNSSCAAGGCGSCSSNGACSIQQGPVALVLGRRLGLD
ncbi:FeoC-like transcriptional regulator [uncultured Corynebacterium sp.]|uniref:FeoC-like transcriptional regulator n=1 Tax=uncultured Corynebacterium sp. TaxID=159447 RepID=UPI002599DE8E|nr:FeoC-like transcriptional regulator [uncultured Corynebacterium sp.]